MEHPDFSGVTKSLSLFYWFSLLCESLCLSDFVASGICFIIKNQTLYFPPVIFFKSTDYPGRNKYRQLNLLLVRKPVFALYSGPYFCFFNLLYNLMQCVGNKAIVFCIFQAYNRLSMHQVIFIVVRSSDRGDLVVPQYERKKPQ